VRQDPSTQSFIHDDARAAALRSGLILSRRQDDVRSGIVGVDSTCRPAWDMTTIRAGIPARATSRMGIIPKF
jgi:hypothetical protein